MVVQVNIIYYNMNVNNINMINIIIKSRWAGHVTRMEEGSSAFIIS